jgi:hypothetical protein
MTQWFGKSWGAPCCEEDEHVATPVNEACTRCKEPIRPGDQGIASVLVGAISRRQAFSAEMIYFHLDCYLRGILPHGPECPHCRGVEPRKHAPDCGMRTTGLCTCIPMPEGQ